MDQQCFLLNPKWADLGWLTGHHWNAGLFKGNFYLAKGYSKRELLSWQKRKHILQTIRTGFMSCHSFDQKDAFCSLYSFLTQCILPPTMFEKGNFDAKENMLILLTNPGEVAPWVYAMLGNFFALINLSEQVSQHNNDTACISPSKFISFCHYKCEIGYF